MKTLAEFVEQYHRYISCVMGETGFRLHPLHALDGHDGLNVAAIDLEPEEAYRFFWSIVSGTDRTIRNPRAVILGLDRTTRPGQGTEFADVLTCLYWWDEPGVNWGKSLKVGVINYQYSPRIVRPWDWDNPFWTEQVRREARATIPPFRIRVETAPVPGGP